MRIVLITPYEFYTGGVETVNSILINIFKENGHSVELITTDNFQYNIYTKFMTKLVGLPFITSYRFKNIDKKYDIVIANGEFGYGIKHPKVINLFHGSYKGYRDYLKKLWNKKQYFGFTKSAYIQKLSAKNHYVVTVSQFIKEILNSDSIEVNQVIPNCVDTELFREETNLQRNDYLFVGAYNYYAKGFDILEQIADNKINIFCVTNKKPSDKLSWIENIDNSKMVHIYNQYKILIFPSRFEGLPMVPLEAMSCGLPIIMSNVGLGPELKKIIPEFVVEDYDNCEYYKRIKLIENNYEEYSKKARNYVEKYHSYQTYKKQWLELIERVNNA